MSTSIDRTDSSLITISTLNELHKFYAAGNGDRYASKPLILNNTIQFRLDLFPNGLRKEQLGYVQFIVVSNKLPSNVKSIAVLCRLYCKEATTLFKEVKIFKKGNEAILWPIYYLHRDECKYNTHYNDRDRLQFGCDIELLHIKYCNNSIINNLKLKIRKNSVKNINSHNNNRLFSYATLRSNAQIQYEWTVDKNIGLFKHARNGKAYYSNDINNIWCLCCYPNGQYPHNEGQLLLSLKLIRLPPKIKCIQTNISLQMQHKNQSNDKPQTISFSYSENEYIWSTASEPFATFVNAMKFMVVIEIHKLFQDVGKNKGREISRTNWSQYGIDILGVPEKSNIIDNGSQEAGNINIINRQKYSKSMVFYKQHSRDQDSPQSRVKLRSIRSFSQRAIYNPAASEDVTSNTFPRSNRLSTTATVEYSTYSVHPYTSSSHRSSLQISPSLYKKITPTQTQTRTQTPAIIEEEFEQRDLEIHQIKFKEWLHQIGLNKYFDNFERNDNADIRDIVSFDHVTLIGIGVMNKPHRNRIVDASMQYATLISDFDGILKKSKVLNNFAPDLRRNGILTLTDLEAVSMNALKQILNINKSEHNITDIWNLIHPETHLKSAINELEERHKNVMNEMDTLMIEISEMNNKIETANVISVSNIIKEKYEKIVEKTYRQLTQHHTQLNEFKSSKYSEPFGGMPTHQRFKKSRHSTNTISSINSSTRSNTTCTTITTDNYAASHLTGSNTAAGIDDNMKSIKMVKYKLIIYGYMRGTALRFNINIPLEVIDFCINYYQKD